MASIFHVAAVDRVATRLSHAAVSRVLAAIGFSLFSLLTLIVLLRRLSGAFSSRISFAGFCACLIVAGLICCSLKLAAEWPPYRLDRRTSLLFGILIGLPLDVLAISLLPAHWPYTWLATALAWSVLVGWFCLSMHSVDWCRYGLHEIIRPEIERFLFPSADSMETASQSAPTPTGSRLQVAAVSSPAGPTLYAAEDQERGAVLSELQRRSTPDGDELLEGQLVATFAPGTRQTILHVPFIPPFSAVPRLDCEVAGGSDVRVKVGAVFPYGARLELKRSTSELPELLVEVEIYAEVA